MDIAIRQQRYIWLLWIYHPPWSHTTMISWWFLLYFWCFKDDYNLVPPFVPETRSSGSGVWSGREVHLILRLFEISLEKLHLEVWAGVETLFIETWTLSRMILDYWGNIIGPTSDDFHNYPRQWDFFWQLSDKTIVSHCWAKIGGILSTNTKLQIQNYKYTNTNTNTLLSQDFHR